MKYLSLFFIGILFVTLFPLQSFANDDILFLRAKVLEIQEEGTGEFGNYQKLRVELLDPPYRGKVAEIEAGDVFEQSASHNFLPGETLIVRKMGDEFVFSERYRLPAVFFVTLCFLLLALLLTKKRGFFALFGLVVSFLVILFILIPALQKGTSPLLAGIFSCILIASISLFLAHGFRKTTIIALISTIATLSIAGILSELSVAITHLFGVGSEEAFQIQLMGGFSGEFRGLLLAGILIGTLGVLDDITTTQVAIVEELKKVNTALTSKELFQRGSNIGNEHLLSMLNTLVLAYTGASLPLFLLFFSGAMPVWAILNSEILSEEIIRTLVGSTAILIGIPLTNALAAFWYGKEKNIA